MKKLLLFILFSSNFALLSSESDRLLYVKDTCNRTYDGIRLFTDKDRRWYINKEECEMSRFEVRDKISEDYIASIAYDPSKCSIKYLSVDPGYKNQGIGSDLAKRAIADMRAHHDCREISLWAVPEARKFWEKLGAEPRERGQFTHVFSEPSSELS